MCELYARRHGANWKWERSFNLTLCHAPKSSAPCVFFWISLVHPSATSLPFSAHNSRIHNGRVQRSAEGWATINDWLFSIRCSHCGCYDWFYQCNRTRGQHSTEHSRGNVKDFKCCGLRDGPAMRQQVCGGDCVNLQSVCCLEEVWKSFLLLCHTSSDNLKPNLRTTTILLHPPWLIPSPPVLQPSLPPSLWYLSSAMAPVYHHNPN